jgi:hypothetical protein
MKYIPLTLLLMAFTPISTPENGNLISEPILSDYREGQRTPGILGTPEEIQDEFGNPASL